MKSYSVETGGGIIQDFSIAFKEQQTSFLLERWEYANSLFLLVGDWMALLSVETFS
jgi:hypothetical protein